MTHSKGKLTGLLGVDIPDAATLFKVIIEGQSNVKLFYVDEVAVEEAIKGMPENLTLTPGHISYHDFSCLCSTMGNIQ